MTYILPRNSAKSSYQDRLRSIDVCSITDTADKKKKIFSPCPQVCYEV
jgi:hypothetical protein